MQEYVHQPGSIRQVSPIFFVPPDSTGTSLCAGNKQIVSAQGAGVPYRRCPKTKTPPPLGTIFRARFVRARGRVPRPKQYLRFAGISRAGFGFFQSYTGSMIPCSGFSTVSLRFFGETEWPKPTQGGVVVHLLLRTNIQNHDLLCC